MDETRVDFRIVIPARYASERLPGKPLLDLAGRPMIEHVWRRACESGALEVWIATDDERIARVARGFGASVMHTDASHASGTDRVAEVVGRLGWPADSVVVNVQGDEPLIPPAIIAQVAGLASVAADVAIATLATALTAGGELADPNVVKVVAAADGRALYFSRAGIPHPREPGQATAAAFHRRHVGIYAYRVNALQRLAAAPPCELEQIEKLEQLRALWLGMRIQVADACVVPPAGVDTPEDLARVRGVILGLVPPTKA